MLEQSIFLDNNKFLHQTVAGFIHKSQVMIALGRIEFHVVKVFGAPDVFVINVPINGHGRVSVCYGENRSGEFAVQICRYVNPGRVFRVDELHGIGFLRFADTILPERRKYGVSRIFTFEVILKKQFEFITL